jgi:hypothetical protein
MSNVLSLPIHTQKASRAYRLRWNSMSEYEGAVGLTAAFDMYCNQLTIALP